MQRSLRSWVGLTGLSTAAFAIAACATASGCNTFDEPIASGPRTVKLVPTDERAPTQGVVAPLPVSGGTLLSLGQASSFAISDPDRDQISVTKSDGQGGTTFETVALPHGAQPGRMALTTATTFAAVLRGSGEVVSIDSQSHERLWQTPVCNAPRGLDFELATNLVHVACAEGTLVSLDATTGEVTAKLELEPDLRDVVAKDGRLYVSRFRSAEVLFVEQGAIAKRIELPTVNVVDQVTGRSRVMQPAVAWRMLSNPSGGVAVVHQRATTDEVPIESSDVQEEAEQFGGASPYGGVATGGCDGIVQTAVSQVDANGARRTTGSLSGITLPVDLAFAPDGITFAVADAGLRDPDAPRTQERVISEDRGSLERGDAFFETFGVHRFATAELMNLDAQLAGTDLPSVSCANGFGDEGFVRGPVTAVAFDGQSVVTQDQLRNTLATSNGDRPTLQLGQAIEADTGHELFHRNSGGGMACASCHPEGTSDGHVWRFKGLGKRRTQDLAIPLAETEPFHWDGTLADVGAVMDEVFVERMGGVFQTDSRIEALSHWLVDAPKPVRSVENKELSASAERGKELFESKAVGCASCHSGRAFTDNRNYFVGTGGKGIELQVPSLVGLAARPPYMHDGCAKTLLERFDPECGGGDQHGRTSQLSSADLDDLVAYLRTL